MKTKNPVIKKNNKWYNTISKRYVTETYAKRVNSYFARNPDGVLTRATGHGILSYKKRQKASRETLELSRKKTILIETKTITGKDVYYSPKYNEIAKVTKIQLKKVDYNNRMWKVSLYRKSLDKLSVYHVLQTEMNTDIETEMDINYFMGYIIKDVIPVLRYELNKIFDHYISDKRSVYIYGKMSSTIYSEIDYFPMNSSFGFHPFNKKMFISEFINIFLRELAKFLRKIKNFSYHSLHFDELSVYINQSIRRVEHELLTYREGVENIRF